MKSHHIQATHRNCPPSLTRTLGFPSPCYCSPLWVKEEFSPHSQGEKLWLYQITAMLCTIGTSWLQRCSRQRANCSLLDQPRLEGTSKDHWIQPSMGKGSLDEIIPHPVQQHLETHQCRGLHYVPVEAVPLTVVLTEKLLSYKNTKLLPVQFILIPPVFSM